MTTGKKFSISIMITAIFAFLAFAAFVAFSLPKTALADAENIGAALLTPVASDNDDVKYYCFDDPNSVFGDGAGLIVACDNGIYNVSGETEITAQRALPAVKAYRHLAHGEHSEYIIVLYNGVITLYCGDADGIDLCNDDAPVTGITDFAVYGDALYAVTKDSLMIVPFGNTDFESDGRTVTALHALQNNKIDISAVTVIDGIVYVVTSSTFGSRNDICSVTEDGELLGALMQSDAVLDITSDNNFVYTLTRDKITAYTASSGGLIKKTSTDGAAFTSIYAYGGYIYAVDSLNALHKITSDLQVDKTLLASSSDVKGYFNTPNGVAVKNSTMYVADTLNNRIAIYGNEIDYVTREFINPVSVYRDSANTVYVAYEYNKIGIFAGGDFSVENERTVFAPELGYIVKIVVDANKNIYVLSSNGLWVVPSGKTAPERLDATRYIDVTLGIGRDKLYVLGGDGVFGFDGESATKICDAPSDAVSLAVDLSGSVFMLTRNSVVCYNGTRAQEYSLSLDGEKYELGGGLGQIVLSTVRNKYVAHGDVIIVDSYKHRILKTSGATLGVKLVDENYTVPDLLTSTEPEYYGSGLIRTAIRNTEVFALPMESDAIFTITRGRNVIVPAYALEETQEYALILIDDIASGKLIQGYVFRDALSEPLPYSVPPATVGTVFNAATPIYKYPSRHALSVRGYAAVDSNTKFNMLDFVESYRDDYGNLWYRVALDNNAEGFILAVNVSTSNFEPVFIRPSYNAEIISYKDSTFAVGYSLKDGEYTEITQLPTGTQVEVIGAFDSSEKYTEVKYVDSERGTLTCYVETVYIRYNGVNIVLLVAIVVIMITVILASVIIARIVNNKRKNLVDDKTDDEE